MAWVSSLVVGPLNLDRALFGWVVTVPLAALAAGLAATTVPRVEPRSYGYAALAIVGLAIAVGVALWFVSNVTQVGCDRTPSSLEIGGLAIRSGLVAGFAYIGATLAAISLVGRVPGHQQLIGLATGTILGVFGVVATGFVTLAALSGGACAPI